MDRANKPSTTSCISLKRRVIATFTFVAWIVFVFAYARSDSPTLGEPATKMDQDTRPSVLPLDGSYTELNIDGHSYRFFEGIRFINRQQTAKFPENVSDVTIRKEYESLVDRLGLACDDHVRMGRRGDGGWHVCVSPPYNLKPPCLVYDFGIANSWSFDDAITKEYGCLLRAFDPTNKLQEHDRSDKIHFYPIGLWGSVGTHKRFPATTFRALLERFGEATTTVDYLKIDIEKSEWDALPTMLEDGTLARVKQIGMEVHAKADVDVVLIEHYTDILERLNSAGFRLWRSDWNKATIKHSPHLGRLTTCHEMYFLNINFMK